MGEEQDTGTSVPTTKGARRAMQDTAGAILAAVDANTNRPGVTFGYLADRVPGFSRTKGEKVTVYVRKDLSNEQQARAVKKLVKRLEKEASDAAKAFDKP